MSCSRPAEWEPEGPPSERRVKRGSFRIQAETVSIGPRPNSSIAIASGEPSYFAVPRRRRAFHKIAARNRCPDQVKQSKVSIQRVRYCARGGDRTVIEPCPALKIGAEGAGIYCGAVRLPPVSGQRPTLQSMRFELARCGVGKVRKFLCRRTKLVEEGCAAL